VPFPATSSEASKALVHQKDRWSLADRMLFGSRHLFERDPAKPWTRPWTDASMHLHTPLNPHPYPCNGK